MKANKTKNILILAALSTILLSACSKIEGSNCGGSTSINESSGNTPVYINMGTGYLAKKIIIDGTECVIITSKYTGSSVSPSVSCKW